MGVTCLGRITLVDLEKRGLYSSIGRIGPVLDVDLNLGVVKLDKLDLSCKIDRFDSIELAVLVSCNMGT